MKHISLDREDESVKLFVRSLPMDPDGSVLELAGEAIIRVLPIAEEPVDFEKLREAIRSRRDESRALNEEWNSADREVWERATDVSE